MDRQYTLCVLVPAQQYRSYIDTYAQQFQYQHYNKQCQYQQQQHVAQPEQIYENVVSQYHMRLSYQNDYENEEQIQRFYWEQCYRHDENDATAYYYCEYVGSSALVCLFCQWKTQSLFVCLCSFICAAGLLRYLCGIPPVRF